MNEHAAVEQEAWYDAVYADKDLTMDLKVRHLHACASDYDLRLQIIGEIVNGTIGVEELRDFLEERRDFIDQEIAAGEDGEP